MKNKRFWLVILIAAVVGLIVWVASSYNNASYSGGHIPYHGGRVGSPCEDPAYKKTHTQTCK
jgi:hypothetical protein